MVLFVGGKSNLFEEVFCLFIFIFFFFFFCNHNISMKIESVIPDYISPSHLYIFAL